jgi:hypothetical protein
LPAVVRIFGEASGKRAIDRHRHVGYDLDERRRLVFQDRADHVRLGRAVERLLRGDHFVHEGAKGEDVRARVCVLSFDLLRRHVLERSEDRAFACQRPGVRRIRRRSTRARDLRHSEVEQLDARLREHDVGGLQVAVDNAVPVGLVERVANLGCVFERAGQWQRSPL